MRLSVRSLARSRHICSMHLPFVGLVLHYRPLKGCEAFVLFCALTLFVPQENVSAQSLKRTIDSLNIAYNQAVTARNDTLAVLTLHAMTKTLWGSFPDSAMVFAQRMLADAQRIEYRRGIGLALNNIGYIYRKKSRFDDCLEYSNKALVFFDALGDKSSAAWCFHNIGNVHYARGRYDLALDNHFKALRLREAINEKASVAWSFSNISDIYRDQGYKDQAIMYTQKAIAMFQEVNDDHGVAVAMNGIGVMLQEQGKYDEALGYFMKALALDEASEHGIGMMWSTRYIGELSMLQQRYDRAETYFLRCLELTSALKDRKNEGIAMLNLARLYSRQHKLPQAFALSRSALALADSLHVIDLRQSLYELFAELYAASGKFDVAYEYHRRYSALHDSLFSAKSAKKIAELGAQYEDEKRKIEIEILTKDNALQEATLKRDGMTRNGLIAGVMVLLVIAGLLVQRNRFVQKSESALQQKNDEIMRQQKILEDQAAEIEIANSQLQEQNLILQQLNIEKNEFLGIAAHDLKNPLTAITMSASSVRDYYDRMPAEAIQERLGGIVVAAQRMASTITNLLDINAIETGNMNVVCKPTSIEPIVQRCVSDYKERAQAKQIILHYTPPNETMQASIDASIMAEILDNLISNALKYSPLGKQVFVRLNASNGKVRIETQDEGPGLSAEDKTKLFGKFARLSAQPTGGEHSTGLGLSIVKRFAEAMNGHVWCESELGAGATFIVEFPSCESETASRKQNNPNA